MELMSQLNALVITNLKKNLEDIFSIYVYFRIFQELKNSCVTIGKKIGRKLGGLQRTSALREAIAGRIKVLFSISLHNRFIQKEISV